MATVELPLSVDPFAKLPIMKASFELSSLSSIHMNVKFSSMHIAKKQSINLEVPVNKPYIIPQTPHVITHAQV